MAARTFFETFSKANSGVCVVHVLIVPGGDVRQRPDAVDARVGPKIDEDDLPSERLRRYGCGDVHPFLDTGELGHGLGKHGQIGRCRSRNGESGEVLPETYRHTAHVLFGHGHVRGAQIHHPGHQHEYGEKGRAEEEGVLHSFPVKPAG
jgi:hypothetical protein